MKILPVRYHNRFYFAQNIPIRGVQEGGVTLNKKEKSSSLTNKNGTVEANQSQDVLEISSTGYGLESVDNSSEQQKEDPDFCGGL